MLLCNPIITSLFPFIWSFVIESAPRIGEKKFYVESNTLISLTKYFGFCKTLIVIDFSMSYNTRTHSRPKAIPAMDESVCLKRCTRARDASMEILMEAGEISEALTQLCWITTATWPTIRMKNMSFQDDEFVLERGRARTKKDLIGELVISSKLQVRIAEELKMLMPAMALLF